MRNAVQVGGRKVVRLGDKDVEWDDSFRLYLITHLPNPAYGPEVASKTMLINYSVTEQARPHSRMPNLLSTLLNTLCNEKWPILYPVTSGTPFA